MLERNHVLGQRSIKSNRTNNDDVILFNAMMMMMEACYFDWVKKEKMDKKIFIFTESTLSTLLSLLFATFFFVLLYHQSWSWIFLIDLFRQTHIHIRPTHALKRVKRKALRTAHATPNHARIDLNRINLIDFFFANRSICLQFGRVMHMLGSMRTPRVVPKDFPRSRFRWKLIHWNISRWLSQCKLCWDMLFLRAIFSSLLV